MRFIKKYTSDRELKNIKIIEINTIDELIALFVQEKNELVITHNIFDKYEENYCIEIYDTYRE